MSKSETSVTVAKPLEQGYDGKSVFHHSPTFHMACRQLEGVADVIDIDKGVLQRYEPTEAGPGRQHPGAHGRRTHGSVHRLPRAAQPDERPVQGRAALSSERRPRRGGGPGHVDVVEVRHHEPALRRRQGRHRLRPGSAVARRTGTPDAPLHRGSPVRSSARAWTSWPPTWAPTSRRWPGSWTPTA